MSAEAGIAVVVPVLRRPHRVAEVMANVAEATQVPHRLLFVASAGDDAELLELGACGADYVVADWEPGHADYARKINLGYRLTSEPYVFTGADDLRFHKGWDAAALAQFRDGVGVVGTDDMGNPRVMRGEHSTHSLVARWYADEHGTVDGPGAIYAEVYPHEFVDDEMVETAKWRKAWAFAHGSKVEHLHPFFRKAPSDALYEGFSGRMKQGRRIYQTRKRKWSKPVRRSRIPARPSSTASLSVVVATYGDPSWQETAKRAVASVECQVPRPAEIHVVHGQNLAEARNEGARASSSPWLVFLDADDELEQGYLAAMWSAGRRNPRAGLLNPAVRFVYPDGKAKPVRMFKPVDLSKGNYLVIGTAVRSDLFWKAGGFDQQWEAWEDWAMYRRVVALGGRIVQVPRAVYRAHWASGGRNNTVAGKQGLMERIHRDFAAWSKGR